VSLEDVAGYARAKKQIVDTLRTPLVFARLYEKSPVKLPRSVLLYGPPGCGKTLLAQAAGREFGRGYIAVRGPELLNKYIGASEKAVRELFQRARDSGRPCLIFFDEFESLAPRRGKDNTGVTDRIVNQLLTFIDGVESNMTGGGTGSDAGDGEPSAGGNKAQIFIIAATSRPDLVDPALLRPGRIERHIYVGLPDVEDCADILRRSLRSLVTNPTDADELESAIAFIVAHSKARSLSPADWKAVVNTAYLSATHAYIESQLQASPGSTSPSHAVRVTEEHLLQAFHATRASITAADLQHLSGIYKKFSKGDTKPQEQKGATTPESVQDADLRLSYA
jgi:peroxin-1